MIHKFAWHIKKIKEKIFDDLCKLFNFTTDNKDVYSKENITFCFIIIHEV